MHVCANCSKLRSQECVQCKLLRPPACKSMKPVLHRWSNYLDSALRELRG